MAIQMESVENPPLTPVKRGWAAHGNGWAVHASTREEAIERYRQRFFFYLELMRESEEKRSRRTMKHRDT